MTHFLSWVDRDGITRTSWAYMNGKQKSSLRDTMKSNKVDALYLENMNLSFFTMPINENMQKDDYLEIGEGKLKECYVVTGYDRQSTPGVQYVSVDPVYERDLSPAPQKQETDDDSDFYWFDGGVE